MSLWKNYDLFPKIADDLTKRTAKGGVFSVLCLSVVASLLIIEVYAFLQTTLETRVDIASADSSLLRINFNISLPRLHCDYASVDLWDKIGRNQVNVKQNVEKWQLDESGHKRAYLGRNREEIEFEHEDVQPALEDLHENGVHVKELRKGNFTDFILEHEYVFLNFHSGDDCDFCEKMESTWEVLAEDLEERESKVVVASVDCDDEPAICARYNVIAFPSLRFFRSGEQVNDGEYRFDRTLPALRAFIEKKLHKEGVYEHYPQARQAHAENRNLDHPGCLVAGFLLVNKVPGNFHLTAHSKNHNFNTANVNLSHTVHHISFGLPLGDLKWRRLKSIPKHHHLGLDSRDFSTDKIHQAYHHFIHVVPTKYKLGPYRVDNFEAYQMMHAEHLTTYDADEPPEARFTYELSEVAVLVERKGRAWYEFFTGTLAIVGGTYATMKVVHDGLASVGK